MRNRTPTLFVKYDDWRRGGALDRANHQHR